MVSFYTNSLIFIEIKNTILSCALVLILLSPAWLYAEDEPIHGSLYQVSAFNALSAGGYDGLQNVSELSKHGDFGIGTFEALDGELIMIKGTTYQTKQNGAVVRAKAFTLVSFAQVTHLGTDRTLTLAGVTDIDQMEKALDISFPENNVPMAFKLHGLFSYIQTRSVRAQKKPYPLLVDATKNLPACERRGIAGTIIGFRFPSYFQGIAMAGYTFDFISDDRTFGGHLLNAAADHLNVVVSDTPAFFLSLPVNKPFNQLNLLGSSTTQITVPPK